uniref:Uncharacterized protein n=1 Tax=viral metagenome TaxID=1070528 RepID=A0A6H1Z793_9ZZZZ
MRGEPDLFGEIHEDEIVKIAREAAEKRGYAIYSDFNEFVGRKMTQGRLKPTQGGWYHRIIRCHLRRDGWVWVPYAPPVRAQFYPPGTELPKDNQAELFEIEG